MWKEFKEFAIRGNVLDMAIGIIIGSAFSKIVNSLVNDIIMPPFGLLIGKMDFANLYVNLTRKHYSSYAAAKQAGAPTINYGTFINNVLTFLIVAIVMFFMVREINRMRRAKTDTPAPATVKTCPYCYSSIPIQATRCPQCTSELSATGS